MISTSKEYKEYIHTRREFLGKVTITLADSTVIDIDSDSLMTNGIELSDGTSENGSFSIGGAYTNSCNVTIDNYGGELDNVDFNGARVVVYVGLQLSNSVEYLRKGTYTVSRKLVIGNTIRLVCLDDMYKFDIEYSKVQVTYPITVVQLMEKICTTCGTRLASTTFFNSNLVIEKAPNKDAYTCREAISHLAQLCGSYLRFDRFGELQVSWYDFEFFNSEAQVDGGYFDNGTPNYTSGDDVDGGDFNFNETTNYDGGTFDNFDRYHNFAYVFSAEFDQTDVEITGIQITYDETVMVDGEPEVTTKSVLFGTEGYVLDINNNRFITTKAFANRVVNDVGNKLVGMKFRPMDISISSDPCIEAGDIGYAYDYKGTQYQTLVTNLRYNISGQQSITCDAESMLEKSLVSYSASTKAIVISKDLVDNEKTARELAIEGLSEKLAESSGLYQTVQANPLGGSIYYMHNKPVLAESDIIWKMTADAFGVSTDGGKTWNAGLEADGNIIAQRLSVVGINADWINAGSINANRISGGEISGVTIRGNSIIGGSITGASITGNNISGGSITGVSISGSNISSTSGNFKTQIIGGEIESTTIKSSYIDAFGTFQDVFTKGGTLIQPSGIMVLKYNNGTPVFNVSNLDGAVSCGSITTSGNVKCSTINGYTPIHSGNIGDQRVLYATTSGSTSYANSSGSIDGVVRVSGNNNFIPSYSGVWCGTSGNPWAGGYGNSGWGTTSDRRKKKNISDFDGRFLEFARMIKPQIYQLTTGESNKYHSGFIAQEIEYALFKCGIGLHEFSGLVKEPIYNDTGIVDYVYYLVYDEFIPLLFLLDKEKDDKINDFESRLARIESQLSSKLE